MKKECGIVQDLLFGYNDGVLSEASKELVEKHLKECEYCKEALKEIKEDSIKKNQEEEIDYLKRIKKKLNKKTIYMSIGIILLVIVIGFNVISFKEYYRKARLIEIYLTDDVTEEQLSNIKEAISNAIVKDNNNGACEVEYISKEREFEKMKSNIKDQNLLEGLNSNDFPASLSVYTNTIKTVRLIEEAVKIMPGIKAIHTNIGSPATIVLPIE